MRADTPLRATFRAVKGATRLVSISCKGQEGYGLGLFIAAAAMDCHNGKSQAAILARIAAAVDMVGAPPACLPAQSRR